MRDYYAIHSLFTFKTTKMHECAENPSTYIKKIMISFNCFYFYFYDP